MGMGLLFMYLYVRYSNNSTAILIARISANDSKHFSATYVENALAKTEVGLIFIKLNMSWTTVALALDEGLALAWTQLKWSTVKRQADSSFYSLLVIFSMQQYWLHTVNPVRPDIPAKLWRYLRHALRCIKPS